MNILVLSTYLPSPTWGAGTRSYHLLKALASRHTLSLAAFADDTDHNDHKAQVALSQLQQLTRQVRIVHLPPLLPRAKRWQQVLALSRGKAYMLNQFLVPEMQAMLDTMLAHEHYDAVLLESVVLAGYHFPRHVKVIIDQHNIEHELVWRTCRQEKALSLRKWYSWQEYRLLKRGEIAYCRKADLVLMTSERECQIVKKLLPEIAIAVVPNGVDLAHFHTLPTQPEVANQVIFTGSMDYYPNVAAVLYFARRCWPNIRAQVPAATWLIVGRNPPPAVQRLARLPGVTVTGSVADVCPYLATSAVAIAPLRAGSGTRLKILEALALQKAVVTTSLGCEGLDLVPGQHIVVADQAEAFAQAVVSFLQNQPLRTAFGAAGRSLVERRYSWEKCGAQLLQILESGLVTSRKIER